MSKTVISVEHLSKRYELGVIGATSLQRDLNRWWARVRGRPDPGLKIGQEDPAAHKGAYIWALDDINFKVQQGETLGIIGANGAGKSTLLKVLSQVTAPTKGKVKVKGRIGSLLEVGTGFHPELTGRENVYLNGAIFGMTRAEVERKFDEIVDFSGVEKYIDTPVKRYSSGMYVRLAFAVAAHLDPEILIVDEVLAVGDAEFQKKCLGKMGDVAHEGRTVLFVSHNMAAIQDLCKNAIWINEGKLLKRDTTRKVVSTYLKKYTQPKIKQHWDDLSSAPGNETVKLIEARIESHVGKDSTILFLDSEISFRFVFYNFRKDLILHLNMLVFTIDGICVLNTISKKTHLPFGKNEATCIIPPHLLNNNQYYIDFYIHYERTPGLNAKNILSFEIQDSKRDKTGWYGDWVGIIRPDLEWQINN